MKILIDTNVYIAAFISHGACAELLEHCSRNHTLITSEYILGECRSTLIAKFDFTHLEATQAVQLIRTKASIVTPASINAPACHDPDDLPILGSAIAGGCQCLITGDRGLLKMKRHQTIDIISPSDFWRYETN